MLPMKIEFLIVCLAWYWILKTTNWLYVYQLLYAPLAVSCFYQLFKHKNFKPPLSQSAKSMTRASFSYLLTPQNSTSYYKYVLTLNSVHSSTLRSIYWCYSFISNLLGWFSMCSSLDWQNIKHAFASVATLRVFFFLFFFPFFTYPATIWIWDQHTNI